MNLLKITTANRKWYEIILWWELRRILYNTAMYFIGLLSFYISYVTIPLVYLAIGLVLNIFYTFGWMTELLFGYKMTVQQQMKFPGVAFLTFLILSALLVFGLALYLISGR
ncbi:hypothetical protein BH11BAC3_BH11BAC3_25770 [soil metagenome]